MLVPDAGTAFARESGLQLTYERPSSLFAAAADGATVGLRLAANVAAMLIAYLGLLALIDWPVSVVAHLLGAHDHIGLAQILGWILTPLAWCIGVPLPDATSIGALLGEQVLVNEFVAYHDLAGMLHGGAAVQPLAPRSIVIAVYALCGFSNFSSIAVQVGTISILAPQQRSVVISLALRGVLAGAIARWMTACVAGMIVA
jgi:CNT family concentrative nucleoside transporter